MISISYAVPACTEAWELQHLLNTLVQYLDPIDQIVIQLDQDNLSDEVQQVVSDFTAQYSNKFSTSPYPTVKVLHHALNNDFAQFKNHLKSNCDCDWVFQIDADEVPTTSLIGSIKPLIASNPEVELYYIPRVNIVRGITLPHLVDWGWNVTKIEKPQLFNQSDRAEITLQQRQVLDRYNLVVEESDHEICHYWPVINWPDYQMRLLKNVDDIHWVNPVHEIVKGHKGFAQLPQQFEWSLIHDKEIERQQSQNEFYQNM